MADLDSDEGRPLTQQEISEMRQMLERDKRVVWFWGTARVWATWIAAIGAAYVAGKTFLVDIVEKVSK
jgi:hypothetical protein